MNENQFLTLAQAAKRIPTSNGKGVSTQTMFRWVSQGCRGVRLESVRFGRRICVTPQALQDFAEKLATVWEQGRPQSPASNDCKHTRPRTAAQRERAVKAAEANLRKKGVLPAAATSLADE